MAAHIGTSGWSHDHWEGVLYPHDLPARDRLAVYGSSLRTVELNASFYRWPRDRTFAGWRRRLPDGFVMSVKAPRGLTHAKRLFAPEVWAGRLAAGRHELGDRRGVVVVVQLAPTQARDDRRLDHFLGSLPWWMQVAVELRHDSWLDDSVFDILERHGAAYCVMSGAGLPCVLRATAPFVYVRLHGPDHDRLDAGSYSDDDLRWWSTRLDEWQRGGRDVDAYFNNDGGGNAVRNALSLSALVREHADDSAS